MKYITLNPTTNQLQELRNGSACTMLGYIPEELHLYIEEMEKQGFLKDEEIKVYTCQGSDLNNVFELPESEFFPADLNVFIVGLDQIENIGKFALTLRFQLGFRWLDDIIDNRLRRGDF